MVQSSTPRLTQESKTQGFKKEYDLLSYRLDAGCDFTKASVPLADHNPLAAFYLSLAILIKRSAWMLSKGILISRAKNVIFSLYAADLSASIRFVLWRAILFGSFCGGYGFNENPASTWRPTQVRVLQADHAEDILPPFLYTFQPVLSSAGAD